MTAAATSTHRVDSATLNDYQAKRARNIERNNARLRSLGLISAREESESNAAAWGIPPTNVSPAEGETLDSNDDDEEYKDDTKLSRKRKNAQKTSPSRRSRRVKGLEPEGVAHGQDIKAASSPPSRLDRERETRVAECRAARQAAALRFFEQDSATRKAAKENPTATYGHCLMRVQTMTHKALANRVKVIERAAGKHCVVKMAIFKSCLQDEGLWDLAGLAGEALERLKALQPPPIEK